jgi:hypothetical protein
MEQKTPIINLKQINTETQEGRLLIAAIGKIKSKCCPELSQEQILTKLNILADKIFTDDNTGGHIERRNTGAIMEATDGPVNETRQAGNKETGDEVARPGFDLR